MNKILKHFISRPGILSKKKKSTVEKGFYNSCYEKKKKIILTFFFLVRNIPSTNITRIVLIFRLEKAVTFTD